MWQARKLGRMAKFFSLINERKERRNGEKKRKGQGRGKILTPTAAFHMVWENRIQGKYPDSCRPQSHSHSPWHPQAAWGLPPGNFFLWNNYISYNLDFGNMGIYIWFSIMSYLIEQNDTWVPTFFTEVVMVRRYWGSKEKLNSISKTKQKLHEKEIIYLSVILRSKNSCWKEIRYQ